MVGSSEATNSAGSLLLGKYRVGRTLGQGAAGVVVEALHEALDRKVAVKLLRDYLLTDDELVARFEREGRLVARLDSPHVAKVLDAGRLPGGQPFLVMEHLEGSDLSAWVTAPEKLPIPVLVDHVLQACEGVRAAHAAGIVHRDLKPKNLFCARSADGTTVVKVLDFGISKTGVEDLAITSTQHVLGSPRYMSPEQLRSSRHVDARTDIWALGVIIFELAAKRPPYVASNLMEQISMVLSQEPPRLDTLRPDVPPGLADVVARCLRRPLDERFGSVDELMAALAPFGSGAPIRVSPAPVERRTESVTLKLESETSDSVPKPSSPADAAPDRTETPLPVRARAPATRAGALALAMVLAGAGGFFALRGRPSARSPVTPSASALGPATSARPEEPPVMVSAAPSSAAVVPTAQAITPAARATSPVSARGSTRTPTRQVEALPPKTTAPATNDPTKPAKGLWD